jgi:hypothetical protein
MIEKTAVRMRIKGEPGADLNGRVSESVLEASRIVVDGSK